LRTNRCRWLFSIAFPSLGLQDQALISNIKRLDLSPDREFITLFVVLFKNGSKDEVMNDLVLVKLARMVSMIWLGAVDEAWEPTIKDLVRWGLENIEYDGLAGTKKGGETRREKNRRRKLLFQEKVILGDLSTLVRILFNLELGSEIYLYMAYHALPPQYRDF
jgi:hypothetical protein